MKTEMESRKTRTIALVALATTALTLTLAAPAWADTVNIELASQFQAVDLTSEVTQLTDIIGYAELLEPVAEAEPITDGGDWEMTPVDEDAVPQAEGDGQIEDGGDDENVPETQGDTPDEPGDQADEPDEPTDEPDEPDEPEQPADEPEQPQDSTEPTPTANPGTPASGPSLPFTGGNATPYAIGGLLVALTGVAVLIAKRRVFENN